MASTLPWGKSASTGDLAFDAGTVSITHKKVRAFLTVMNTNANALLRKVRVAGLLVFFGNTFLQFACSLLLAFDVFAFFGVAWLGSAIFRALAMVMATGFGLMFLGSLLQRRFTKSDPDETTLGEDKEFYEHQKQFADPEGDRGKGLQRFFGIALAWFAVTIVLNSIPWRGPVVDAVASGFYGISIAWGVIGVGMLVSLVVGNVNEDVWRLYIRGYHVHESVFGIYFALIGGPLLVFPAMSLEFSLGLVFVASGVFLIGRDWKDVSRGLLFVHKSKEADYDTYTNLKKKIKG